MATKTAKADDKTALDAPTKASKTKSRKQTSNRPTKTDHLKLWAYAGVGITLALSGWLNGMAFSESARDARNGWVLGLSIPVIVLVFSRISATLYSRGLRNLAYVGAGATLSILLLSVQHCAHSIARLTGEPVALAALMALAIDVGLVVAEVATVAKK